LKPSRLRDQGSGTGTGTRTGSETLKEVDVTLTDFGLALEALVFAVLIARTPGGNSLQRWFILFFIATAGASFAGALVHGFFSDSKLLWKLVLISLGVVSVAAWALGARLFFSDQVSAVITIAAAIDLVIYVVLVVFVTDNFALAIANYLPSTIFLLVVFYISYRSTAAPPLALGVGGLVLTLIAAGVQQSRIALHPIYFNHNALYHVLQAIALFLIFRTAAFLTSLVPSP